MLEKYCEKQGWLISAVVEPTAARARLPENLPTTTISTALKRSWRILESMSGMENEISLSKTVPLHMSISYLFFFDFEAVILNPLFIKYKLC